MESLIRIEGSYHHLKLSATVECDGKVFDYVASTYVGYTENQARKEFLEDLTRQGLKLVKELW